YFRTWEVSDVIAPTAVNGGSTWTASTARLGGDGAPTVSKLSVALFAIFVSAVCGGSRLRGSSMFQVACGKSLMMTTRRRAWGGAISNACSARASASRTSATVSVNGVRSSSDNTISDPYDGCATINSGVEEIVSS